MARNNRPSKKEQAAKALRLYKSGLDYESIATVLGITRDTLKRYLRDSYGMNLLSKRAKSKRMPNKCDQCKGPPTERDEGIFTEVVNKEEGGYKWLCCNCLNPDTPIPSVDEKRQELEALKGGRHQDLIYTP